MIDRARLEGVRLAHPLRNQATLITLGDHTKMWDTGQRMSSIRDDPLPAQRMMRVIDDNLFSVTMGSMLCLCLAVPLTSCTTSRYTHRVAISNHRLVAVTDDTVSFRWKDYRHGSQIRTLTLEAGEFLRRFLLHVLPKGFVRIRYFGVLAPRCRTRALAQCRQALAVDPTPASVEGLVAARPRRTWPCPCCGAPMRVIERLTARELFLEALTNGLFYDSS